MGILDTIDVYRGIFNDCTSNCVFIEEERKTLMEKICEESF